ncbi:MAG: ABC transporter permease [Armatimonadetes bacterium]|nr:ABC transporter permease [Armatimonadota bacterium]
MAEAPAGKAKRLDWARLGSYRGVLALAAVFLLGSVFSPRQRDTGENIFLSSGNQANVFFEYSEYGILAAGMTLVILSGGIDLSVGSVLGLSATTFALLTYGLGWSPGAAVLACLLLGLLCGCVNGLIVTGLRLQPFVATLATMVAARGLAKWVTGGVKAQPGAFPWYHVQNGSLPFGEWMTTPLLGRWLQPVTILFLGSIAILALLLRTTRFGRCLYAVGGNEDAARLSGIRTGAVKIAAYTLCGLTAALAGICDACQLTLGDPEAGFTYELDAIAAVVIGGTSLMGGRGGVGLTLLGCLIMAYIAKILSLNGVPEEKRLIAKGVIIVIAVVIQTRRRKS